MQRQKNNYGKYVSFLILIFMLTFIPNVSAATGDEYTCTYNINNLDGKSINILNTYWTEKSDGTYVSSGSKNSNITGFELPKNEDYSVTLKSDLEVTRNSICPAYKIRIEGKNVIVANGTDDSVIASSIMQAATKTTSKKSGSFTYEISVTGNNIEGNKATCKFTINTDGTSITSISWEDPYKKDSGTLNVNQNSFQCAGKTINFWNTNLEGKKLEQETNGVAIADFKNTWMEIYKDTKSKPKVEFANVMSNHYAYFPDYEKDKPYNTGGTTEDNKNTSDGNKDTNGNTSNSGKDTSKYMDDKCDVLPSAIKKYINDALNLIKWVGLVLMIVLGTLDFIKAAAADDQDALKKASKHFMYRLIAVIILFLLPLFIEIILNIAGLMKYGAECWQFGK